MALELGNTPQAPTQAPEYLTVIFWFISPLFGTLVLSVLLTPLTGTAGGNKFLPHTVPRTQNATRSLTGSHSTTETSSYAWHTEIQLLVY